ncbi:MAG: hypothetical protein M1824_002274 [Vezdaea acicularis]|nr:MAG: hypothetical protein M1824_002274 [Vezdaea acicularis]
MTVVRIPLISAKHHFGVSLSRGTRPYNEDSYQAGVIELPAFAKKAPISLTWARKEEGVGQGAESASGDPQVFYFGVFDGHGGAECSSFLREELHNYIEESAREFELGSSLRRKVTASPEPADPSSETPRGKAPSEQQPQASPDSGVKPSAPASKTTVPPPTAPSVAQHVNKNKALDLEFRLVNRWKDLVGGYYRRFKPEHFSLGSGGRGPPPEHSAAPPALRPAPPKPPTTPTTTERIGIESVLMYAFLSADLDFITAQTLKPSPFTSSSHDGLHPERPLNEHDILDRPSIPPPHSPINGGPLPFKGGSTASIALISTPTPTPFWHPLTPCTLLTAHVGDTKLLLCHTATGSAIPLTSPHHPSRPTEVSRLRRYAPFFSTDSFGEERLAGLANTRAFGDYTTKPHGVSAEPEIRRLELLPGEYAFLTLLSDGVADVLSDQEVVDLVKEARTPEQAARDVVAFAVEVGAGDNATAVVVRLGGWERRAEGGVGSLGTREVRELRRREAADPRRGRT